MLIIEYAWMSEISTIMDSMIANEWLIGFVRKQKWRAKNINDRNLKIHIFLKVWFMKISQTFTWLLKTEHIQ